MEDDGFGLDLRDAETALDRVPSEYQGSVVLGVLDGSTPADEWLAEVFAGKVLVLAIEGDLQELAAGFASDVKEADGTLMRFREFLLVAPPDVTVDTSRL